MSRPRARGIFGERRGGAVWSAARSGTPRARPTRPAAPPRCWVRSLRRGSARAGAVRRRRRAAVGWRRRTAGQVVGCASRDAQRRAGDARYCCDAVGCRTRVHRPSSGWYRTCRASRLRPRCAATRTAPARLPSTSPAVRASSPTTARSRTAWACSRGRPAIRSSARSVDSASSADAAVSEVPVGSSRSSSGASATVGRRRAGPADVHRAVVHDRRGPAPEPVDGAGEPVEVTADVQPRLRRHVLGAVPADQDRRVAQQAWLHVAVERHEACLVTVPGAVQRGGQITGGGACGEPVVLLHRGSWLRYGHRLHRRTQLPS